MNQPQLLPSQLDHFNRILAILERSPAYIDASLTGMGKTYVSLFVAKARHQRVLVICPVNVVHKWEETARKLGVEARVATYGKVPPPTDFDGRALLVDEFHYVIHECKRTNAVFNLARHASYTAWISATPFTKTEEIEYFIHRIDQLCMNYNTSLARLAAKHCASSLAALMPACVASACGVRDVAFETCLMLTDAPSAKDKFDAITSMARDPSGGFSALDILDDTHTCVMPRLVDEARPPTARMCAAKMEDAINNGEHEEAVFEALRCVAASQFALYVNRPDQPPAVRYQIFMRMINKSARKLELLKAKYFIKAVSATEYTHKNVVFVNYKETAKLLADHFWHLNPVVINGSVKAAARAQCIRAFNQYDDVRLIVCNTKAACCGIDLDDKVGDKPRAIYISPSFDFNSMLQAIGRVYRIDSKSRPMVRFVYAKVEYTKLVNRRGERVECAASVSEKQLINNIKRKAAFVATINASLTIHKDLEKQESAPFMSAATPEGAPIA